MQYLYERERLRMTNIKTSNALSFLTVDLALHLLMQSTMNALSNRMIIDFYASFFVSKAVVDAGTLSSYFHN
jgi:hypothetical protein